MATPEQLLQDWQGKIVPQSFNGGFVTLSYVVSLIGAASTLELINRRTAIKGIFNQYASRLGHIFIHVFAILLTIQSSPRQLRHYNGRHCHLVHGEFVLTFAPSPEFFS